MTQSTDTDINTEDEYLFVNGVMKRNPDYISPDGEKVKKTTVAKPDQALAVVSSTKQILALQESPLIDTVTGKPVEVKLADSTASTMDTIQGKNFTNKFMAPGKVSGGKILDGLSSVFAKYEVPVGLMNKLLMLTEYQLDFLIDDSGSMASETDVLLSQANEHVRQKRTENNEKSQGKLTRWEEVEDRLHALIDLLKYIPTGPITIHFLNSTDKIILDHKGLTPDQFAENAHREIMNKFKQDPDGGTPIYSKLREVFNKKEKSMVYLFTDGEPSPENGIVSSHTRHNGKDADPLDIKKMVRDLVLYRGEDRKNEILSSDSPQVVVQKTNDRKEHSKNHPLTYMICTDDDSQISWINKSDNEADSTSAIDDLKTERQQVLDAQGAAFPYTKGFYLLCMLVSAINQDLDNLDEKNMPLTKRQLTSMLGYQLTPQGYAEYANLNSYMKTHPQIYAEFVKDDIAVNRVEEILAYEHDKDKHSKHSNASSFFQAPQPDYSANIGNPPPPPYTAPSYH